MMARSTLPARAAPWAMAALVTVAVLTAGTASAQPTGSGQAATPVQAPCLAGQLAISVPDAIRGDPAEGMGKQAWNVVFRDTAGQACSLHGWPGVAFGTPAGKKVAVTVSDVTFSNLALIPAARIVLRPGQSAVVTAISASGRARCVTRWTLGLTLPGAGRPVTLAEPAGA